MVKTCTKCRIEKPLTEFYKNKRCRGGHDTHCKDCMKASSAAARHANPQRYAENTARWRRENPERHAANEQSWRADNVEKVRFYVRLYTFKNMLEKHGKTIDRQELQSLINHHDGRCKCCKTREPGGSGTWHMHHDHSTGNILGFLCSRCNLGMGIFDDSPELLAKALTTAIDMQQSPLLVPRSL